MDIRLVVLICVVFINVNAEKGRKPNSQQNQPLTLGQEITNFFNAYADIVRTHDLEGIRDSWTEDGALVITVHGLHPFYGQMEMVDHFDKVFKGANFKEVVNEMTAYGEVAGTNGKIVWATVGSLMYGEESEGGFDDTNPIANLTASFILKRNICDDDFRIQTQGCAVNFVARWLEKYLQ